MRLHPADISKELKSYSFFKTFTDDLLLQLATMVQILSVKSGDVVIQEGNANKNLFFLRRGEAQVILGGEIIATFSEPGEVMGEMSVITDSIATTTIAAVSDCELYVLNSEDFNHVNPRDKDKFDALLYKVYSVILIDRLAKTNQKARLYEILNREINEAQKALQTGHGGKVLLLESDRSQQIVIKMAVAGTGVDLTIAGDTNEAKILAEKDLYDIVICEDSFVNVIQDLHKKNNKQDFVLLTTQGIVANLNTLSGLPFVSNVISRELDDRQSTIRSLLITLQKVLNKKIFGLEKYLAYGIEVSQKIILGSADRHRAKDEMVSDLKGKGIRNSIVDRVYTSAEELLMNAVYDAPVSTKGTPLYNHESRKHEIKLESHQQPILRYATDGLILAVSVADPFGSLQKESIWQYLLNCYGKAAGTLNDKNETKAGAGRGLHQIVENADLTIFNVKQDVRTEVICLFYLDNQRKDKKPTFHYFFID